MENKINKQIPEAVKIGIYWFSIAMLLGFVFLLGANLSCDRAEGVIVNGLNVFKVKCLNMNIVDGCTEDNIIYIKPND